MDTAAKDDAKADAAKADAAVDAASRQEEEWLEPDANGYVALKPDANGWVTYWDASGPWLYRDGLCKEIGADDATAMPYSAEEIGADDALQSVAGSGDGPTDDSGFSDKHDSECEEELPNPQDVGCGFPSMWIESDIREKP
jgi:hypothetical protein